MAKETKDLTRSRGYAGGTSGRMTYDPSRYSSLSPLAGSPFIGMRRLAEEMDRMFNNFGMGGGQPAIWAPQIETFRRKDQLVVRADLPGMDKDNVNVEVENNILTISGERQDEHEEERDDYYRSERSYGQFYRAIPLPEGVDADQVKANFKDGVLEVILPMPKSAEPQRTRIDIH